MFDPSELTISYARAGGPGGQHVNTTNTKVVLRWAMADSRLLTPSAKTRLAAAHPSAITKSGDVVIHGDRYRSPKRNYDDCIERLTAWVREARRVPKKRRATKPTLGSKRRRLDAKKRRSSVKKMRGKPARDD